jgi:hypothetical protein
VDRDDLLQPTLTGHEARPVRDKPWRLGSQVYVAFFGGAFAVGAIAFLNTFRLGMPTRTRAAIVAIALAAEAALFAAIAITGTDEGRIASILAGLVAYGGVYLLQRSPDRVYHFHSDDEESYESLFGPGLVACIVARIVEIPLIAS